MKTIFFRLSDLTCLFLFLILATLSYGIEIAVSSDRVVGPLCDAASGDEEPAPGVEKDMSPMFTGRVVEVIDAGRQYYLKVDNGSELLWIAVQGFDGKVGDQILVPPGVPMTDFHSRKLNRDFALIYFVGTVHLLEDVEDAESEQTQ